MKIAVGGVVLILAIGCIVFLMKGMDGGKQPKETETESVVELTTEPEKTVYVEGIDITGMTMDEARSAILDKFGWSMKVTWQDQTYEVADLMEDKVSVLLAEIYSGTPKESYTLDTSGLEEAAKAEAAKAAAQWDKKAKNGAISSYDASSGKFVFSGEEAGHAVDQEKLAADILDALNRKDFGAALTAVVNPVEPEISEAAAREKYKTIGSFTTKTTSNSKRNNNIKLSCQAINGIVLQPGEEFSFNDRVGQRTEAKGYQGAAAYNNGEVVQEIGGGVCQTSSTLYNAVVKAGLKTTSRRSHTFEPSYVTPGTDATVSWGGPDYAFVNNSSSAVGIRASYANQEVTISIYGIPVLEEGVKYSLKSTKLKDIDPPAPVYEEDGTVEPGAEKVKSSGSKGSQWETRLVITKNGEVVSQEVDHTVTYKGHAPVILRNTSGTMAPTESSSDGQLIESITDPSNPSAGGPQEGSSSGVVSPDGNGGSGSAPGTETSASSGEAPGGNGGSSVPGGSSPQVSPTPGAVPGGSNGPGSAPGSGDGSGAPGGEGAQLIAPNPGA